MYNLPTPDELRRLIVNPALQLAGRGDWSDPTGEIADWRQQLEQAARTGTRSVYLDAPREKREDYAKRSAKEAAKIFHDLGYRAESHVGHSDPGGEDDYVWYPCVKVSW